jgi:hypothetical protein
MVTPPPIITQKTVTLIIQKFDLFFSQTNNMFLSFTPPSPPPLQNTKTWINQVLGSILVLGPVLMGGNCWFQVLVNSPFRFWFRIAV